MIPLNGTKNWLRKITSPGGEVFPETQSEIGRVKARIAQSELIVAAYEKKHRETT